MNQPQPLQNNNYITKSLICEKCKGTEFRKNGKNPTGSQIYQCKNCQRSLTSYPNIFKTEIIIDSKSEYLKDCWDSRALGIKGVGDSSYKLNFIPITQDWLRETAKKHCKVRLSTLTFSSVQETGYALRKFSNFNF